MLRKIKQNYIVLILIFLSVLTILILQNFGFKSYSRYSTDTLHYDKGVVVEISNEDIEYDKELKIYLGSQDLKIKMSEGIQKGKIIEVTNYLTKTHNVHAKIHMPLIINIDQPDNIEPYYTVYNYDRTFSLFACAAVLAAAIFCIGGGKGLKSIAGLLYSMLLIIEFLLPAVFSGWPQYHMCHTVHGSYSSSVKRTKRENIFRDFIYNDWNVFCAYSFPYHICHDPCGRIQFGRCRRFDFNT